MSLQTATTNTIATIEREIRWLREDEENILVYLKRVIVFCRAEMKKEAERQEQAEPVEEQED